MKDWMFGALEQRGTPPKPSLLFIIYSLFFRHEVPQLSGTKCRNTGAKIAIIIGNGDMAGDKMMHLGRKKAKTALN
jgi:hypothetical protein